MNNIDNINSINNMSSIHDSINDNLDSKTQWNVRMLILQNGICCGIFKNIASSSLLSDSSSSSRVPVTTSLLLALSIDGQFLLVCGSGAEIILENGERLGLTGTTHLTRYCPKRFHTYVKMLLDFRNKFGYHRPYTCKLFNSNTTSNNKEIKKIFHMIDTNIDDDDDDDDDDYDNEIMTMDNNESAAISLSSLSSLQHELPLLKGDDFNAYPLIPTIVEYVDGDLFMLKKQDNNICNANDTTNTSYSTSSTSTKDDDVAYTIEGLKYKSNSDNHVPNYNNVLATITLNGNIITYKSLNNDTKEMKETLIHLSCFTTDIDANGTIENYDLLKSEENVEPSLITIISTLRWHVLRLMTYRAHLEQRVGLNISSMKNIIPEKFSEKLLPEAADEEEKVVSIISSTGAKLSAIRNAPGLHPTFISVQGLFKHHTHDNSLQRRAIERTHVTVHLINGKIEAVLPDGQRITTILEYCIAKANSNMVYNNDPVLSIIPHVQELLAFLRWANLSPTQRLEQKQHDEEVVRRARAAALQNNRYLLTRNIKSSSLSPLAAAQVSSLFEARLNMEGSHGSHYDKDQRISLTKSTPTIQQLIDGASGKSIHHSNSHTVKEDIVLNTIDIVEKARQQMKMCAKFLESNKGSNEYDYRLH